MGKKLENILELAEFQQKKAAGASSDTAAEPEKKSKAQVLIELAGEAQLFHTPDGNTYATFQVDGHKETWPLRSKGFKRWLLRRFYQKEGKPGGQALEDALATLEAKAHFDGPELPVYTRVAGSETIYLDLGNESWQAVEITSTGWQVVSDAPVKFRRARGMAALPVPVKGGSIDELRAFVNVPDEDSWRLLVAWLVMAFRPTGPYPILILQGEQGSAKSTTARVLRALVDPSTAPLRTTPREERDLMIAANNAWVLAFDNLSGISPWLSDALCRLATGGGFATRELYTDSEEVIFDAMRPVVINGIDELTSRQDLLDRAIILNLPAIPEEKRRDETAFWREFEEARPRILGALLDAVSSGLRNFDAVKLDRLPRMADFAKWVTACEEALPWEAGDFMAAYAGNREDAIELALEADIVAVAVKALLEDKEEWEEKPTNLLETLRQYVPEDTQRTKAWPKSPRSLSSRLRRAATFLRQTGIEIEFYRTAGSKSERRVRLIKRLSGEKSDATVASVAGNQKSLEALGFSDAAQMRRKNGDATQGTFVASHLKALSHKQCDERDASDARKCTFSNASIVEAVITDPAKVREAESLFPHPTVQRSPFRCPRCGGEDFWQDEKGLLHCSGCAPREGRRNA